MADPSSLDNATSQAPLVDRRPCLSNHVYLKFFKPRDVISSHKREQLSCRPIVSEFYPLQFRDQLRVVGRLDCDSEGLLLLTTDGQFVNSATSPDLHLQKEYYAVVYCGRERLPPSSSVLARLVEGVELRDGLATAEVAELLDFDGLQARLRIIVTSGRNRMVRRMLQAIGYSCQQLLRVRIGPVGGLAIPSMAEASGAALSAAAAKQRKKAIVPEAKPSELGDPQALEVAQYAHLTEAEVTAILQAGGHGQASAPS